MQFFKKKMSGIITHLYPPTTTTCPTFSLKKGLSSLFPPPSLLLKCSHTEAHCSKGPIHEAKRQWRKTQRAPHTAERTLSSALTPEGCVWAAPRHTGPADTSLGSSLLWAWPLAKLPKQPQTDLQLSITTRWEEWEWEMKSEWLSAVASEKPQRSLSHAKCWQPANNLRNKRKSVGKE